MSKQERILAALESSGRYELLRFLGKGAGSLVWAVRILQQEKEVALKILPEVNHQSPRYISLRREVALASRLDHPNILRVLQFVSEDKLPPCIEMELAPGGSLADLAASRGGYLDWITLKPYILQLCEALDHAHLAGVVHRDLKPSNLLLAADGSLRLADFGCGCLLDATGSETTDANASGYHGTLPFMSPQQLNGHPPHPSDDLYALGVTLHSLLVGQTPFHRGYLIQQILKNPPPSVDSHQRELHLINPVPKGVQQIILATLQKDRDKRPASAADLREQLERERSARTTRRNVLALLATGCAAPVGLVALARFHSARSEDEMVTPSQPPARTAAIMPVSAADREVLSFALQPDGGMLVGGVFTRFGGQPSAGLVRLKSDGSLDPEFKPEVSGIFRSILVLPDQQILVGGDLWDSSGQSRIHLALLHPKGGCLRVFECDSTVLCMNLDPSGNLVLGGLFNRFENRKHGRIARLDMNLKCDPSFAPLFDGNVHSIVPTDDGGLLVGGCFTHLNGGALAYLARLDAAGRRGFGFGPALDQEVTTMARAPNGSLLVGGKFTRVDGQARGSLIRLRPDGSLDETFSPALQGNVFSLALRRDGSLIAGGDFNDPIDNAQKPSKRHRDRIASIDAAGAFDETFRHSASGPMKALAFDVRNGLLLGGGFNQIAGRDCDYFHTISNDSVIEERLEMNSSGRIVWHRAAFAQHVQDITFEISRDAGKSWQSLGRGQPCEEGWQIELPVLRGPMQIRVLARSTSGIHNGSSGLLRFPLG